MAPFDTYTQAKINEKIAEAQTEGAPVNRLLYDGDHWLSGEGWIGPRPAANELGGAAVLARIARAFISKNVVRELCDRHTGGVIGLEPSWKLTTRRPLGKVEIEEEVETAPPTDEQGATAPRPVVKKMVDEEPTAQESALIDEAEAVLTEWWDERGALGVIQDAVINALLAERGVVRLYVPPGLLKEGKIPRGDLAESLRRIYIHAPTPEQAAVYTDPLIAAKAGLYTYESEDEKDRTDRAEIVALDDAGRTVIRVFGGQQDAATEPLDLGGYLTIAQIERSQLITPQIRQQQALLNLALTMLGRNVEVGGFIARILFNAQLPGSFVTENGVERFVPDPIQWGAGVTNNFLGAEIRDDTGRLTGYSTPSYVREEPVDPSTFLLTKEAAYRSMLEEAQQLHALIAGDATASGESRKQARADFEQSLGDTMTQVNRLGRWLIEATLAMAAAFSGQPGKFKELRAVFECRIDSGPISAEDLRLIHELSGGQPLFSQETAMSRAGVDDVDAELVKLSEEGAVRQARAMEIAQGQGDEQGESKPPFGREN